MRKLEICDMENIHGEGTDLWGLAGLTCMIAIGSAITLTVGTFGAGALLGATVGTVGCGFTTSAAIWF